ncbi:hypothetical protein PMI04_016510 [Sphingobium sp. AP49]|uniref:hypothetical protein n=1 Tax=Sphingobium sp. AP49 TaxID=1144307 RepID=UPI00026ECD95|nr:hypothetical protein [Sphingobium sp. AP49]WHO38150.1 hypothetical protein PMI04_016510 [Sphingobium sp. AP49]
MSFPRPLLSRLSLAAILAVAACAAPEQKAPPTPPPPVVETVMPRPPMNAVEEMSIPDKGDDGKYLTPNRGVTNNTALWHVRMALNVAALNCTDARARQQYNQLLAVHRAELAEANAAVERNYGYAYGRTSIAQRERLNTVVYNFFALPPVTKSFCPVAIAVGARLLALPPGQLLPAAPQALTELEKPFQDFYEAYADYLRRLAEWQSRFGGTVTLVVSPTPLPPPPIPPGDAPPQNFAPSVGQVVSDATPPPPPPGDAAAEGAPAVVPTLTPQYEGAPAPQYEGAPAPVAPAAPPPVVPTQPQAEAPKLPLQPVPAPQEP